MGCCIRGFLMRIRRGRFLFSSVRVFGGMLDG